MLISRTFTFCVVVVCYVGCGGGENNWDFPAEANDAIDGGDDGGPEAGSHVPSASLGAPQRAAPSRVHVSLVPQSLRVRPPTQAALVSAEGMGTAPHTPNARLGYLPVRKAPEGSIQGKRTTGRPYEVAAAWILDPSSSWTILGMGPREDRFWLAQNGELANAAVQDGAIFARSAVPLGFRWSLLGNLIAGIDECRFCASGCSDSLAWVDPETLATRWRQPLRDQAISGAPEVLSKGDDLVSAVYTKSSERCIGGYALISWSQSGEQRWRTPLEDDSFRLLGDRDHIYVWWDYPSSIQALDRASGRTIWRRRYHECVRAIVPLPGRVLVLVHDEATETVETATGQLLQQQLIDDASLRHSNFEVRWPWIFHQGWEDNERSSLHAIHLVSGRQWAQRLPLGKDDSVWERDIAVSEERAYVPTIHGLLFALDLSSGRQLWFSHIGSDQSGGTKIFPARPPGAKEEWVLVSPLSGHLLALDPTRPLPPA